MSEDELVTKREWLGEKQGFGGGADNATIAFISERELTEQRSLMTPLWKKEEELTKTFYTITTDLEHYTEILKGIESKGELTTDEFVMVVYKRITELIKRTDMLMGDFDTALQEVQRVIMSNKLKKDQLDDAKFLEKRYKDWIELSLKYFRRSLIEIREKILNQAIIPLAIKGLAANRQQTGKDSNLYSGPAQSGEED